MACHKHNKSSCSYANMTLLDEMERISDENKSINC